METVFPLTFHPVGTWQHPQLLEAKLVCSWWHSLILTTFTASQFYAGSTYSYFLEVRVDEGNKEVECRKNGIKNRFKNQKVPLLVCVGNKLP